MKKENLKGLFIVSCQAYEDNPLYGTENTIKIVECVLKGGAQALRVCWPDQIKEVKRITNVPIIGINKVLPSDDFNMLDDVFITPSYESAVKIIEAGCDVVAMDGTLRKRVYSELEEIVKRLKVEYPHIILMADIASLEEGMQCEKMGFDILSTTLSGYTRETERSEEEPDIELIKKLKEKTKCLVNGEGRIWNKEHLELAIKAGADMVTIGSAITNPMKITSYFGSIIAGKSCGQ